MSEHPQENLSSLLRTLKQQDAVSLRSLLANEINAVHAILKLSGHNTSWDQRHVGLLLDRWSNVVTLMSLSESIAEAYAPRTAQIPPKRPVAQSPQRAEQSGPDAVRRALNEYSVE